MKTTGRERPQRSLIKPANKPESNFDPDAKAGIPKRISNYHAASVAQSMPEGFSVGVLSTKFDFTNPPRRPKPETAWIFSEERFLHGILYRNSKRVPDEALAWHILIMMISLKYYRCSLRSLKTFIALYYHFPGNRTV